MASRTILADADLFISYLTGDDLERKFSKVVKMAESGEIELLVSSEVYDDVISALRSQGIELEEVTRFVSDMRAIPHDVVPVTVEIARNALRKYLEHGGSRKLHYFDSFHVATAGQRGLPFLTSDKYIIQHAHDLGIETIDVRTL